MTNENLDKELFHSSDSFGDKYHEYLLEQYKIYVEMADKNISRRNKTNEFFLSANSFLLSALAILSEFNFLPQIGIWWLYVASSAGIVLAITWLIFVRSYRQLSTGKFEVINQLEKKLPAAPFTTEWSILGSGKDWKKYTKMTRVETIVPIIFCGLYIALSVGISIMKSSST